MQLNYRMLCAFACAFFCLSAPSWSQSFTITNTTAMCNDDATAEVVLSPDMPLPVTVTWYNMAYDEEWTGLNPTTLKEGSYTVTVTDANGVTYESWHYVDAIIFTYQNWPAPSAPCPGGTAPVDFTISGGTAPFEVFIDDLFAFTTSEQENTTEPLSIGSHTNYIVDANGCRSGMAIETELDSSGWIVFGDTDLDIEINYTEDETLCGHYDVTYTILTESTPPYVNYWSYYIAGESVETYADALEDVPNNTFITLHSTDANGCERTFTEYLTEPNNVQGYGWANAATCPENDGSIDMTIYGGTAPYTFLWSNGETTEDLNNLAPGGYSLTATDAEGCSNTFYKYVYENVNMSVIGSVTPPNCEENIAGEISISVAGAVGGYTAMWNTGETGDQISVPSFGYYTVTVTDGNGCTKGKSFWIPPSPPCYAYATGTTYYDLNGNCVVDAEDFAMNASVNSSNGNYAIPYNVSGTGNYGRKFLENVVLEASDPQYTVNCPAVGIALAHEANENYTNQDFFLQPNALNDDVCVSQYFSNPVPGFETNATIHVSNPGTTVANVLVDVTYTPLIQFVTSNYTPSLVDNATGHVTYTFIDLMPNETRAIHLDLYTNPTVALGEEVTLTSTLMPNDFADINPANNTAETLREVIGSYDPNDKRVWPEGEGENNRIDPETAELEYMIRFQNTGTAPAVNVVIEDDIDLTTLDIASIEVFNTSHSMTDFVVEDGQVSFVFEEIYLPDSTSNLEASQGFVSFRIKVNGGLPLGAQIENKAAIFFDFNAPIITNIAMVTLDEVESVGEEDQLNATLYPNPSEGLLYFSAKQSIEQLNLTDLSGRLVYSSRPNVSSGNMDLPKHLANGTYIVTLEAMGKKTQQKIVLQR